MDAALTIHNFTAYHNLDLRVLYTQKNSGEILKEPRNTYEQEIGATELSLLRALLRITHVDAMEYLGFMSDLYRDQWPQILRVPMCR